MTATPERFRRGFRSFASAAALAIALSLAPAAAGASDEGAAAPLLPAPAEVRSLGELGRGVGVVFSPDFSVPTNRLFYERLGFAYFEDSSWEQVLSQIERHNAYPPRRIETVIVTCHGSNGHGLKLQTGKWPAAPRSYVSIGGLQERLGRAGVRAVVISACNTGRLFRPEIYKTLDATARDPLFLPATRGFVNSSPGFDPAASGVTVFRRADSVKENALEGQIADLSPAARRALGIPRGRFVLSDLFMQLVARDPALRLASSGYAEEISRANPSNANSDLLFARFVAALDTAARRQDAAR